MGRTSWRFKGLGLMRKSGGAWSGDSTSFILIHCCHILHGSCHTNVLFLKQLNALLWKQSWSDPWPHLPFHCSCFLTMSLILLRTQRCISSACPLCCRNLVSAIAFCEKRSSTCRQLSGVSVVVFFFQCVDAYFCLLFFSWCGSVGHLICVVLICMGRTLTVQRIRLDEEAWQNLKQQLDAFYF